MADIKVKLVKSLIGSTKPQIATAHALGLHKIGDVSVQPDSPATQGKVRKLSHLIEVTEAEQGGAN
ncbi:MAG: 50S ribosomal protein L30 [Clostridiaceae bacterium]|nr:50S ribosomal protein L30 [Clostridiaceae bacterium]MDO4494704.1 50S ribosomal protein L30 [Clostridiaceae bacterium]